LQRHRVLAPPSAGPLVSGFVSTFVVHTAPLPRQRDNKDIIVGVKVSTGELVLTKKRST